jgi:hypothetical protein
MTDFLCDVAEFIQADEWIRVRAIGACLVAFAVWAAVNVRGIER